MSFHFGPLGHLRTGLQGFLSMLWGAGDSVTCHRNSSQSEGRWSSIQNPLGQPWWNACPSEAGSCYAGVWVLTDQCGHPDSSGERKPCTPPVSQCEVTQGPANFPFCLFQTEVPAITNPHDLPAAELSYHPVPPISVPPRKPGDLPCALGSWV